MKFCGRVWIFPADSVSLSFILTLSAVAWLEAIKTPAAAELVVVQAEAGTLGTNFFVGNSSGVIYISNTNNNTGTSPGIPGRIASYTINFPEAGTYDFYAWDPLESTCRHASLSIL